MPQIRIYQFRPESQPPTQVHKIYNWFKTEISTTSIEPVISYEITDNDDLISGSSTHLSLATKLFKGFVFFKKAFKWFKQRS